MYMQEPERSQSFEETGATSREYGTYRAQEEPYEQEQKVHPQERLGRSVLDTLIIVFSSFGWGFAIVGVAASIMVLSHTGGSLYLLIGGILGLVGSVLTLLCLVTVFVLFFVSASRRARRYR